MARRTVVLQNTRACVLEGHARCGMLGRGACALPHVHLRASPAHTSPRPSVRVSVCVHQHGSGVRERPRQGTREAQASDTSVKKDRTGARPPAKTPTPVRCSCTSAAPPCRSACCSGPRDSP